MRLIRSKSKVQYLLTGILCYQQLELSKRCTSGGVSYATCCLAPEGRLHSQLDRQLPSSCPPQLL